MRFLNHKFFSAKIDTNLHFIPTRLLNLVNNYQFATFYKALTILNIKSLDVRSRL